MGTMSNPEVASAIMSNQNHERKYLWRKVGGEQAGAGAWQDGR
jgi:hypothetical protein